eukprot:1394796-Amphidinium_carterae.1
MTSLCGLLAVGENMPFAVDPANCESACCLFIGLADKAQEAYVGRQPVRPQHEYQWWHLELHRQTAMKTLSAGSALKTN